MVKKLVILTLLLISRPLYAATSDTTNFEEADGSPTTYPYKVIVSNGTLTDNGDGTSTLTTGGGGGTPGGANENVQFNSGGSFGGAGNLNWDDTDNRLRFSADSGQVGIALVVSNDAGVVKASISYDGGATANSLTLAKRLSVDSGGTGLTSGTSGGILAFTAGGTISSSNLLTASAVVVGGGSGAAPTTITADTATIGHFLASTAGSPAFRQIQSNDMAGVFDTADGGIGHAAYTKGDILVASGTNSLNKLAVGSMGQMLSVDTGAVTGVKWVNGLSGGRSISLSGGAIEADTELYTDTKCIWFENPVATDDFKSIWFAKQAATLTSIWAESDQTVTFMLQVDDGTPADVDTVDLAPAAGTAEDTSLDGDATMAAGDRLDLAVTSVSGTPTWCSICWTFTYDD